jgi:hypothetical protein
MSAVRKFNVRTLFDAFSRLPDELEALFTEFGVQAGPPFNADSACSAILDSDAVPDEFMALLYELNDLSGPEGLEQVEAAMERFGLSGPIIEPGFPPAVAALRLRNADPVAFQNALDRLFAHGLQGKSVALFPGRTAVEVRDERLAAEGFERELTKQLSCWKDALGFSIRPYTDGRRLVILVFCERAATVQLEFDHSRKSVKSLIRRPVIQDMLIYNQDNGELEIDASYQKHREILRSAFATGVMGDERFFRIEEETRVLNLQSLVRRGFALPVQPGSGHSAMITGIKVKHIGADKPVTFSFGANRHDAIEFIRDRDGMGLIEGGVVTSVRIELVLGPRRTDRKSIELTGSNRIKFNRSTRSEDVYEYLRHWSIMGQDQLAAQSAA